MKNLILAGVVTIGMALVAPSAWAHREDVTHDRYTAADKLGRGFADMTTGFLEFPGNIVAENRDHGAAAAATIGVAKGIGMIPVRELIGVYDVVTSPIPVPHGYRPLIHPEYPWGYFEGAPSASFDRRASR